MLNTVAPLRVDKTSFLLERLSKDCQPLQYIREYTQNSIEACLRRGVSELDPGRITWRVDEEYLTQGFYKLSVIDNGDGMTAAEQINYLNKLACSGSTQSVNANFGLGAKISGIVQNTAGIVYSSWKDGAGSQVTLKKSDSGDYGLYKYPEDADGRMPVFLELSMDDRPMTMKRWKTFTGTRVVFLGSSPEAQTICAPEEVQFKDRWLTKSLNMRYFRFPDHIKVATQQGLDNLYNSGELVVSSEGHSTRYADGQGTFLDKFTNDYGCVEVDGARIHWWIVTDDQRLHHKFSTRASYEVKGHIAGLYKNELYGMDRSTTRFREFGLSVGYNRIILYIEPDVNMVTTDTARSRLLDASTGADLPWSRWAEEFSLRIPKRLQEYMNGFHSKSSLDRNQDVRQRLLANLHLFDIPRYRPARNGDLVGILPEKTDVEPTVPTPPQPGPKTKTQDRDRTSEPNVKPTTKGMKRNETGPRRQVQPTRGKAELPQLEWISVNGSAESDRYGLRAPDELEDRAASYDPATNLIRANLDYRVFQFEIELLLAEALAEGQKGVTRTLCEEAVMSANAQALSEAVYGAQALKDTPRWNPEQFEQLISPEGLTAAIQPRTLIMGYCRRQISGRLGK